MDRFVGGDCCFFIPALRDDDGGFPGGLADDHALLIRDDDSFEADVAAEGCYVKRHPGKVFRWSGVASVEFAVDDSGDLAVDAGPGLFHRAMVGRATEDFVFAGAIRDDF